MHDESYTKARQILMDTLEVLDRAEKEGLGFHLVTVAIQETPEGVAGVVGRQHVNGNMIGAAAASYHVMEMMDWEDAQAAHAFAQYLADGTATVVTKTDEDVN